MALESLLIVNGNKDYKGLLLFQEINVNDVIRFFSDFKNGDSAEKLGFLNAKNYVQYSCSHVELSGTMSHF